MAKQPEIPKLECEGCRRRDEMIRRLAERVDELERKEKPKQKKRAA